MQLYWVVQRAWKAHRLYTNVADYYATTTVNKHVEVLTKSRLYMWIFDYVWVVSVFEL